MHIHDYDPTNNPHVYFTADIVYEDIETSIGGSVVANERGAGSRSFHVEATFLIIKKNKEIETRFGSSHPVFGPMKSDSPLQPAYDCGDIVGNFHVKFIFENNEIQPSFHPDRKQPLDIMVSVQNPPGDVPIDVITRYVNDLMPIIESKFSLPEHLKDEITLN